jgi:arylsulfatase
MGGGFRLVAEVEVPEGGADGVICSLGDWSNGWAWYVLDGRPTVAFSLFGAPCRVAADAPLASGGHTLEVGYVREAAGGGPLTLCVDGVVVADGTLPEDLPFRWQIGGAGLRIGHDAGFPVNDDYAPPFPFSGTIHDVAVVSSGSARSPDRADVAVARAVQRE